MTDRRMAVLAVTAFAIVMIAGVLLRPAVPIDETRYLSVAWEMWLRGDYFVPYRNGAIYAHKPPLLFWLINSVWAVTGPGETAARLVGPTFALASLPLAGALAGRLWPDSPGVGARAVVALAGTTLFAAYGGLTMFDALLTFCVLAGLLALLSAARTGGRSAWVVYGAAIGFGVLAKGPVILIHLFPALLLVRLWLPAGQRAPGIARGALLAFGVALAVVALWLVPAAVLGGAEYRQEILWSQSAGRVARSFAHGRPIWFFAALLPALLFPWIWSPAVWRAARRLPFADPGVRLCLVWFGAAFLAFSLISGKQAHYLLPELPAAALLVAVAPVARTRWELAAPAFIAISAAIVLASTGSFLSGDLDWTTPPWVPAAGLAIALAIGWGGWRVGGPRGLAGLGLGLVLVANLMFGLSGARGAFDAAAVAALTGGADAQGVAVYGRDYEAEFNFVGRLRNPVANPRDPAALDAWLAAHPEGVVIAEVGAAPDWEPRATRAFNGGTYGVWFATDR